MITEQEKVLSNINTLQAALDDIVMQMDNGSSATDIMCKWSPLVNNLFHESMNGIQMVRNYMIDSEQ